MTFSQNNGSLNEINYSILESQKCYTDEERLLSGSKLEYYIFTIVFPPICLMGLAGNMLNLVVLLSKEMKSRANSLLACLAFCDIAFLLLMIPHSLANIPAIGLSYYFRIYYLPMKVNLITFANWSSAAAIWLVVAVCAERLIGIRYPFYSRGHWSRWCFLCTVISIVVLSFALTLYNHFWYDCTVKFFCNDTQPLGKCLDYFSALNAALIIIIKKRSLLIYQSLSVSECQSAPKVNSKISITLFRRNADQLSQQRTEHRIAITVCAIVTCFTITQAPSAVVQTLTLFLRGLDRKWAYLHTLTAFLVIVGKSLNFILFCLSSGTFRRKLITMLKSKAVGYKRRRNSNLSATAVTHLSMSVRRSSKSNVY
uniref:G_PROTEIN_RECEP_F1_2 domain-containing protein n=1 Tax=Syphacia muris TaxID=451379 RepID=A0A0N5AV37_9BILA